MNDVIQIPLTESTSMACTFSSLIDAIKGLATDKQLIIMHVIISHYRADEPNKLLEFANYECRNCEECAKLFTEMAQTDTFIEIGVADSYKKTAKEYIKKSELWKKFMQDYKNL